MELLYLVHRIPYPPDKGDKVRSFHILRHLSARHRLHLGTFIDDPGDFRHLPAMSRHCASICVRSLSPRFARIASLRGLVLGEALSLPYYRDAQLLRWVRDTLTQNKIDAIVIFSSVMAQYVLDCSQPLIVDFVDMDSAKWRQYAEQHAWPMSWIYRRESERLFAFEREIVRRARRSFFVTEAERRLFLTAAPEADDAVGVMGNGVDAEFFDPQRPYSSPYREAEEPLVFTGAMDYLPNADAAIWFAQEVLPPLLQHRSRLRFYVVGRNPTPAVRALANDHVVVTGTVADVRPYLAHARLAVAPLRIARGIQNKLLEAMAMAKPVVASRACAEPLEARPGQELLIADGREDFITKILEVMEDEEKARRLGAAGRAAVLARFSWDAHLAVLDRALEEL